MKRGQSLGTAFLRMERPSRQVIADSPARRWRPNERPRRCRAGLALEARRPLFEGLARRRRVGWICGQREERMPTGMLSRASGPVLELDGQDLHALPLSDRKKRLTKLLGQAPAWHRAERAHRRGRRHHLPTGLRDGIGGHRIKAAERALRSGPSRRLGQGQEPGQPGSGAGAGNRVVKR
jgi:hypothetical protein